MHIIRTNTPGGPVDKDVWVLHPDTPNEDGIILTADGYGGNFINTADAHHGPYPTNWDLLPAMVQLGIPSVRYGNGMLVADPEVWGGG